MRKHATLAIFVALGLALVLSTHASYAYYAPTPTANKFSTTVTPGKTSYGAGETIVITGTVKPYESGRDLEIIIRDSSNNIAAMESATVNPDGTYSFSMTDTAKWKKDNYKVAAQYGYDDVDVGTASFSFDPAGGKADTAPEAAPASSGEITLPPWIKSNAKFWSDGTITDKDFVSGIQYMIKQGIIKIPTTAPAKTTSDQIPSWVKSNAKWWADGTIGDKDFVSGLQYMISQGIIRV